MAKKQKSPSGAVEKQLKAGVKKLKAQLAAAEKSAATWKTRAKAHEAKSAERKRELKDVRRLLAKAEKSAATWKTRARATAPAAAAAPDPPPAPSPAGAGPDETWTVTALRAEARSRQVPGYSRKTKAQLLVDLRG